MRQAALPIAMIPIISSEFCLYRPHLARRGYAGRHGISPVFRSADEIALRPQSAHSLTLGYPGQANADCRLLSKVAVLLTVLEP